MQTVESIIFLAGLGLLIGILYGSYKSISHGQRNLGNLVNQRVALLTARVLLLTLGTLFGILLTTLSVKISDHQLIVGLPFPWAVWENSNGQWHDFVSPLSIVVWMVDLIVALR